MYMSQKTRELLSETLEALLEKGISSEEEIELYNRAKQHLENSEDVQSNSGCPDFKEGEVVADKNPNHWVKRAGLNQYRVVETLDLGQDEHYIDDKGEKVSVYEYTKANQRYPRKSPVVIVEPRGDRTEKLSYPAHRLRSIER